MNDIWNFFMSVGDFFRDQLSDFNPLPILIIALLIGIFQSKPASYALKSAFALVIVLGLTIFYPLVTHHQPKWPDLRHLGPIVQYFLMYILAYGMVGVLGGIKTLMKSGAAKTAH